MKSKLLLSATLLSASFFTNAQNNTKTYAITGKPSNNFLWADIKQVDIASGKVTKTLFDADKTNFKMVNLDKSAPVARNVNTSPTGFGVAACALDPRSNRLYFATMHFADIRFLDLNKEDASFTTIKSNAIGNTTPNGYQPEENHITRMVIGADGYGYALTNDANHLFRFSTSKNPEVTDLGNLVDADNTQGMSIHNKCSSWGGDMVADAFGKLWIVSASHSVFSVDINTRVAAFKGTITGLAGNFSTNGAAVNDEGDLVVSSANVFEGLYKVNMKTLAATKIESKEPAFNASDLANGNLLYQKEANDLVRFDAVKPVTASADAKVYPNPVTGSQFNVVFDGQPKGKYTILLTDIAGRTLQSKVVTIVKPGQVETVRMAAKNAKGMYLVKVLSDEKKLAFSDRLVID